LPDRRGWFSGIHWKITAAALVLACLCLGIAGWLALRFPTPEVPRLSIVVLPFVNLSNDPDQEYFADGLTSNLTTDVAHVEGSFVIAANTAFTYKHKPVDAREIGRELGVRYVLGGSVERDADQIRINAQLVDAETGSHLWAEAFNRERGELFTVEEEITARIANTLNLQLTQIEARRAEERSTSTDATDYVMRGNALWLQPVSRDRCDALQEMYTRALQLDDRLPAALNGLAHTLARRVLDGFSDAREDDLRHADDLVSRVLAANPNDALAHYIKGEILRANKHFDEAIAECETAIALDPIAVAARNQLARAKILIGEPAAAIPLLEQAMRISPRDPDIGYMQWRLGYANLLLGNTDEAIRWDEKSVLTFYDPASAYMHLAAELGLKGDKAAAQAALAESVKLNPDFSTIAQVRSSLLSNRPKFLALAEQTLIQGLRKAGLPE
jgi:TolB-like protein/Flp pilus assembly protein TadD